MLNRSWAGVVLVATAVAVCGPVAAGGARAVESPGPSAGSVPDRSQLAALDELFTGEPRFCATSEALDRYLEGVYRAALAERSSEGSVDAASGALRIENGIWVVESDDTILYRDFPQDLEGSSLRYVPNGNGFDVTLEPLQYDPDLGVLGIDNAPSRLYLSIALDQFPFPFGGGSYSVLYAGTDLAVRTQSPLGAPLFSWDQYTISSAAADLFTDRVDRLSPLFYARGDNWGRYLYVKRTPDKVLITWRTALDAATETFFVDVQAALFPDGQILYSYQTLKNVDNGAPLVYAGVGSWINGFVPESGGTDPLDASPPAADIVQVAVEEDPASDIVRLTATMADVIPQSFPQEISYWLTLSQQGQPVYRFLTWVDDRGRNVLWRVAPGIGTYIREAPVTINGASWDVLLSLSDLPELAPGPVDVVAETEIDQVPVDSAVVSASIAGGAVFARDYTAQAPFSSSIPIVESFLYPWFIPHGVKDKLLAHTGWDETLVDGMPMYQSFFTDIILWGGAYYTYGNCAAAGVGPCDPASPPLPGLLHMSKPNLGWNQANSPDRFTVLSHEFGHHWLQLVDIDEGAGPSDVLNPESQHPAAYVHTDAVDNLVTLVDASVMGGAFWTDNGNGTYSTQSEYTFYSYAGYELYLMGLMDTLEVPDWFYLDNTNPPQPRSYWPAPNVTVTGVPHLVTIQMLLDAMGPRQPAYPNANADFFVPMVIVVRPGQSPSASDWTFLMSVRDPWRSSFGIQTHGRGTVTTVSPREVSPPDAAPLRVEKLGGGPLRLYFEDPGFGDQMRYNVYEGALNGTFDDWTPASCGSVPGETGAGELFLDVTPPLPSQSYYYLVTMSNVAVEGGPGSDSTGTARTTTGARCGGQ